MTGGRLVSLLLRARLALAPTLARRGGLEFVAAMLLAAGAALWIVVLPQLQGRLSQRQADLQAALRRARAVRAAPAAASVPLVEQRLRDFHAALGDVAHTEQALRTLFAIAGQHQLELDRAEYKLAYDRRGGFYTYAIQLPVTGDYPAVRAFAQQVLLAIPSASLDEIDFKRQDIADPRPHARLRFTLHLNGSDGLAGDPARGATP